MGLGLMDFVPLVLTQPPPSNWWWSNNSNLQSKNSWRGWGSPLVKISASWSSLETCGRLMTLRSYSSQIKCQSTSICFVRSWKTGFSVIRMKLVLSVWSGVAEVWGNPRSASKPWSQRISEQAEDMARYSDSVEDLETLSCFFAFPRDERFTQIHHQPVVDQRVFGHPAQSASE